ncbi:hypothetical protein RM96_27725 [Cupriavidus sp. IDO]|nr:hypothetical protein RM96_27725 [Cupriavidus sp. IDO]
MLDGRTALLRRSKGAIMLIPTVQRPDKEVMEAYRGLLEQYDSVTCALSDCMGRFGAMSVEMRPIFEPVSFAGPAVTARTLASDLAAPFKAIDVCEPGDVIVIDGHTSASTAFWGENMTLSAMNRGVVAAVVDGACRDVTEIRRLKFPVVCRGIVPNVAAIAGYGEVNVPMQCAGVAVSPGDIVVGDENGVVVVPLARCEEILHKAEQLLETEHLLQDKLRAGGTVGQLVGIDEILGATFAYQQRAMR